MVLSNAERQDRYRKKLKARASDPGEALRAAVDLAVSATWDAYKRMEAAGRRPGELAGVETLDQWREEIYRTADDNRDGDPTLADYAAAALEDPEFLTEAEAAACRAVVEARDALSLKHHPRPTKAKGKRR